MPIQCKVFSACIRHFSRRVRSSAAAVLILAGVPGEKMSSDAVVVRKGVGWGYLPPYLPEPVPQIVAALDPEAGALALLDPAGAVPAAVALIAVQLFPFWKRFILCTRAHILASQLAITSKSNAWLFWLFVSSSTASRPLHDRFTGSGCSLFALCSAPLDCSPTLYRHGFGLLSLHVLCSLVASFKNPASNSFFTSFYGFAHGSR